jgi:hypothetical protein
LATHIKSLSGSAAPLFYMVNKNKKLTMYKKKVVNPDDKIVV